MNLWLQHILALLLVAACGGYVLWQAVRTLRMRPGKMGNCCSRGCGSSQAVGQQARRVAFVPVEMLSRRR